jgi:hypothetical protein
MASDAEEGDDNGILASTNAVEEEEDSNAEDGGEDDEEEGHREDGEQRDDGSKSQSDKEDEHEDAMGDEENEDEDDDNSGEEDDDDNEDDDNEDDDDESEDNESEDNESEDEDDTDDETGVPRKRVTEDGREMSEYEMLRLERIRRNQQKLAQLGLEGPGGGGALGAKKAPKQKRQRRSSNEVAAPKRSSLSRESKGRITHYATSLPSVRQMLQGDTHTKKPKDGNANPKKAKDASERMDRVLHNEFRRIRSQKTHSIRQAGRDNRAAAKEVKFWQHQTDLATRKELREQKREEQNLHRRSEERDALGGMTTKHLLHVIDKRMPELVEAAEDYDEKYEAEAKQRERQLERFEMEQRLKTIDALERFPKSVKEAASLLNAVFLERAPKDPPPPRRSKRSGDEEKEETETDKPTKKKSKAQAKEDNTWDQVPRSEVTLPEEEDTGKTRSPAAVGKKRKRGIRNVGGWVSPDFAQKIDRSWLERDAPPAKFDLRTFVPQVGDAVLYFPKGHSAFLKEFPDVLGKKTRQMTRVPLWERRSDSRDSKPVDDLSSAQPPQTNSWWTEDWAKDITKGDGGGRYPILCVVQTVCAEFPPDPNTKVVKKNAGDGEQVKLFFKAAKETPKKQPAKVRLSVTLRPLSPVLPGLGLSLPPVFSVVTFPSKLKPFIVPFAWAYSLNHSMSTGTVVVERKDPDTLKRVNRFDVPASIPDEGRINSHRAGEFLTALGKEGVRKSNLSIALAEDSNQLPLSDAFVVLSILEKTSKQIDTEAPAKMSDFMTLICDTLPVWESVTVTPKDVYDRKKRTLQSLSPWELTAEKKSLTQFDATPDQIAELPSARDESLRVKIDCVLDEVVSDHPSGSLFIDPITDDIAPSYACAVPLGMCIFRIRSRLKGKSSRTGGCFYRSIGSLLSDVSAIVENCLLYNSPESSVVEAAVEIIASIKEGVSRVVRSHNKEINALQKADEERRRHVLQLCGEGNKAAGKTSIVVCRLRKPFKHHLYCDWLQEVHRGETPESTLSQPLWIPQAGEKVSYSRGLHAAFVQGHHLALELGQCDVLAADVKSTASEQSGPSDFIEGDVVWTKAVFPRSPAKNDSGDSHFPTNSTLLAVGVVFKRDEQEHNVHVIYWRPCKFAFDADGPNADKCEKCGLSMNCSFLRPSQSAHPSGDHAQETLTQTESDSIEKCFSLLKSRVLGGISPVHVEPALTKANVKQGYEVPQARHGLKSLPVFEEMFEHKTKSSSHATRKPKARASAPPSEIPNSGYLAHWMADAPTKSKEATPRQHETISPWPKLCLELIRIRLRTGHYRTRTAIVNDLIEAFSSVSSLMVSEPASRKNISLSVKMLAKHLSSTKGKVQARTMDGNDGTTNSSEDLLEEWTAKLILVRDLYCAALICINETEPFERITGLHIKEKLGPSLIPVPSLKRDQNSIQVAARERLRLLIEALDKDPLSSEFKKKKGSRENSVPTTKLAVICGGQRMQYETYVTTLKRAVGTRDGSDVKVRVMVEGKEVHIDREVPRKSDVAAALNGVNISLKATVNGEEVSVPDRARLGRDEPVREVINDFIAIRERDFEGNDTLARFTFGRPGRMSTCARCQAHRRSMLICRVRRGHSNPDFDWIGFFDNFGGIDGILEILKTGKRSMSDGAQEKGKEDADRDTEPVELENGGKDAPMVPSSKEHARDPGNGSTDLQQNGETVIVREGAKDDKEVDHPHSTTEPDGEGSETKLEEALRKAKSALALSEIVLKEAKSFAEAPARLSQSFVEEAIPIDNEDGHFIYCIICGLSGDLLCCDGCANVVHSSCIGLSNVPEGEWFCEQCERKQKPDQEHILDEIEKKNDAPRVLLPRPLPFGRANFDQDRADELTSLVQELRDLRPDVPGRKRKKSKPKSGDNESDSEGSDEGAGTSGDINPLDPLNILTNTAKKFLCAIGITSCNDLLAAKTSVVANKFVKWRKKERLPELRGSGPTAYASMWKRACRDEAESKGLPVPEEKSGIVWKEDSELDSDEESDEKGTRKRKKRRASNGRQRQTKQYDDPWDALSPLTQEFLQSIGVQCADDFLPLRTTDVASKFAKWRRRKQLPKLKSNGETATVSAWKTAVRIAAGVMKPPKAATPVTPVKASPTIKIDTSIGRADRAKKRKHRAPTPSSRAKGNSPREESDGKDGESAPSFDHAFEVLSSTAQEFLGDEGIESAEVFLSMVTGDLAIQLNMWRHRKGMTKLKGSGPGATIAAWRTSCRRAVEALERHRQRITDKEALEDANGDESEDLLAPHPLIAEGGTSLGKVQTDAIATALDGQSKGTDVQALEGDSSHVLEVSEVRTPVSRSRRSRIAIDQEPAHDDDGGSSRDTRQGKRARTAPDPEGVVETSTVSVVEDLKPVVDSKRRASSRTRGKRISY